MAIAYSLHNSCFLHEVNFVTLESENKELSDLTASEIRALLSRDPYSRDRWRSRRDHGHDHIEEFLSELEIAESQNSLKEFLLSIKNKEKYVSIIHHIHKTKSYTMVAAVSHERCKAIALSLRTCSNLRVVKCDSKYQHLLHYLPEKVLIDSHRKHYWPEELVTHSMRRYV